MANAIEQKTFDAAYIGLALQGWIQSVSQSGTCLYRHEINGKKIACGAGHMFRDDQYDPEMECTRANEGLVAKAIRDNGLDPHFAGMIQKCHDGEKGSGEAYVSFTEMNPDQLQAAFIAFAILHELTIPMVPGLEKEPVST